MRSNSVFKVLFAIFSAGLAAALAISAVCRRWVKLVSVTIPDKKVRSNHKIVLISDLHNCTYGKKNEKLIRLITEQKPEYVVIAGDLLTYSSKDVTKAAGLLKSLAENGLTVIYGLGNHEINFRENYPELWETYADSLKSFGVIILDNESFETEDILFSGYTNKKEHFVKFRALYPLTAEEIEKDLPKYSGRKCNFLIAHHPEFFDAYRSWGADRVVSGHLHGGIVRLPYIGGLLSPQSFLFPKYSVGTYIKGDSSITVSAGLGDHSMPFRIFNRRDVTVITLMNKSGENNVCTEY